MNSFIPWIGGKSQLRKHIRAYFPEEAPSRYIEAFGGAGWILFSSDKHAPMEIINDINGNLINLYRCIKYHCKELQRELQGEESPWILSSRELFFDYLQQLDMRGLTDIQRAARYFYVVRMSFGADTHSFGCKNHGKAMDNAIQRLPEIQARLKDVVIENRDFESLIKTYDRTGSLAYLDPPYFDAEGYYDGFAHSDHERLRRVLGNLKGMFILSYNNHPDIWRMYEGYKIHEVERFNCLTSKPGSGQQGYPELIITNY